MNHKRRNRRSIIFYSALEPARWENGVASGADIFCLDLEDSTSDDRKAEARDVCLPLFERNVSRTVLRTVRINSQHSNEGVRDMLAISQLKSPPDGVVIPKVTSAEEVQWVAGILAPNHPDLELIVLIENQKGLENARTIAKAAPQISTLFLVPILAVRLGPTLRWICCVTCAVGSSWPPQKPVSTRWTALSSIRRILTGLSPRRR